MNLQYQNTPVQEISHPILERAGVRVWIKREDLNHPAVAGNKWWKLKYNLEAAILAGHDTVLTFGGAYSNHIYATAPSASALKLRSIGVIRGEETLPLNATLQFAASHGMILQYVSRTDYREKESMHFLERLKRKWGSFYLIPEGGTNMLAVKGCAEFADTQLSDLQFDHLFVPVGTGGTIAGLICGLHDTRNIVGVAVLKEGEFLKEDVRKLTEEFSGRAYSRWSILTQYHHGGYAKTNPRLMSFISEMNEVCRLPLDQVYTGKMLWAAFREIESGGIRRGDRVLILHTGGVQSSGSIT
jgi:1-aminocyclopropane-1-carboxylate deaminase